MDYSTERFVIVCLLVIITFMAYHQHKNQIPKRIVVIAPWNTSEQEDFLDLKNLKMVKETILSNEQEVVNYTKDSLQIPTDNPNFSEITLENKDLKRFETKLQSNEQEAVYDTSETTSSLSKSTDNPILSALELSKQFKFGEKFYHIESKETENWYDALTRCEEMGGQLISLQTEEELKAIRPYLQPSSNYWLDISNVLYGGEFKSESTGQKPKFFNVNSSDGTSSLNGDFCIGLNANDVEYMKPLDCTTPNHYICEANNNFNQ
ncbi:uncharacterized protein LOC108094483 [Drosophila ficusphila]|uniref:uncharacterized protein LOC108094483 n=1 Tax=Drosophila ficusphila TaxID=30025 RepID=UPI0007E763C0|nr:uncharacterized protein LOC108094483 [Drosophila ficusphila]